MVWDSPGFSGALQDFRSRIPGLFGILQVVFSMTVRNSGSLGILSGFNRILGDYFNFTVKISGFISRIHFQDSSVMFWDLSFFLGFTFLGFFGTIPSLWT